MEGRESSEAGGGAERGVEARLFSAWFCPFAQRAWIAAEEKGISYQYVEVDPYAKPPELMAVNPRGLVPALQVEAGNGDGGEGKGLAKRSVYESMVVMEFIDEAFDTATRLLPQDPFDRARIRIWMDHVNRKVVPAFYRLLQRQEADEQEEERRVLLKAYGELGGAMDELSRGRGQRGPFFLGDHFTLLDICLAPWALRHFVLEFYRGFTLPVGQKDLEWLQPWLNAVKERRSVKVTLADEGQLLSIYRRYAENTAESEVAKAINSNMPLP